MANSKLPDPGFGRIGADLWPSGVVFWISVIAVGCAGRDTGAWRCVWQGCPPVLPSSFPASVFAVAGVSRDAKQTANVIFRKLRTSGFEIFPVNPNASEVEGVQCYPNLASVPGVIDGVVVVTHPRNALEVVNQCRQCDVRRVWFHRAFGQGSVSGDAIYACGALGIQCIVGGCPLMYCEPVDLPHRCMRWLLKLGGMLPR